MHKKNGNWIFTKKDCWDLDKVLAPVIHAGLVKFKETIKTSAFAGCPCAFLPDNKEEHTDEDIAAGLAKWHAELDKMIFAFTPEEETCPEYSGEFCDGPLHGLDTGQHTKHWDRQRTDPAAWDKYIKDLDAYKLARQEGRESFGKYYRNLWD